MKDFKTDPTSITPESLSRIAMLINSQSSNISYAFQLSELLQETKIPTKYLGLLRNQLSSQRHRGLALTEMVTELVLQDIQLKRQVTKANTKEEYPFELALIE
jgi:hypothetical protein